MSAPKLWKLFISTMLKAELERRTEFVGPQVGEELATDGLTALLLVIIGIMVYLAFRFEWKFAVAAIIANFHDVILVLGFFSFIPMGVLFAGACCGTGRARLFR